MALEEKAQIKIKHIATHIEDSSLLRSTRGGRGGGSSPPKGRVKGALGYPSLP
jgi:hypothetical protein